jgi:hypothetical protein
VWLLFAWLLLHERVTDADGVVAEMRELATDLPQTSLSVAAGFIAYLVGSLSEDLFGRLAKHGIRRWTFTVGLPFRGTYSEDLSEAFLSAQISRLENNADRLDAEADLRIALLPPFIAVVVYLGLTDSGLWFLGLLVAPALAAQAWIRTRDYVIASQSLFELRQRIGIPPASAAEAESLALTDSVSAARANTASETSRES